jgi:hypothetical protein
LLQARECLAGAFRRHSLAHRRGDNKLPNAGENRANVIFTGTQNEHFRSKFRQRSKSNFDET